jgi:hypothetical protein
MTTPASKPPSHSLKLDYLPNRARDQFGQFGRWLRDCFERDNLIAGLKALAWLAPMTLLIWVYAEREQVLPLKDQTIPIAVRSNDANLYVEVRSDSNIMADLIGPRSRLDEVRQEIQPREGKPSIVLTIPDGLSPGQVHEPDVAQLLNNHPAFQSRGVTVSNCRPSRIRVFVDRFEEREMEVEKPDDVMNLAATPVFNPAKVRVRAPFSALQAAQADGRLRMIADLHRTGLVETEGRHEAPAPVYVPKLSSDAVTYNPANVEATFEVRSSNRAYEIKSMPLHASAPVELLNQYTIQVQQTPPNVIFNVQVIGPPDKIAELERGEFTPKAVLHVDGGDLPAPRGPRRLEFELPQGVRVSDADQQRTVEFKLIKKAIE